jgi:hypothetical protein
VASRARNPTLRRCFGVCEAVAGPEVELWSTKLVHIDRDDEFFSWLGVTVAGGDLSTDELVAEAESAFGEHSEVGVEGLCRREATGLLGVARVMREDAAASWFGLRSNGGVKMDGLLEGWLIPGASRVRRGRHVVGTARQLEWRRERD